MSEKTLVFLKFLFSGALAAAVNFGSRFIYSRFFDFSVAIVLAYITGMVLAFWLFKTRVFTDSKTGIRKTTYRFVLVNVFGLVQTWVVGMWLFTQVFASSPGFYEALSHFIGMSLATVTSYFGHRFFTFRAAKL
jgi:putative flippase GtrA